MVAEYGPNTTLLRRYVHADAADTPIVWYEGAGTTDRRWLHGDERGSIIAVTNASGGLMQANSYDDYGIPAPSNLGRFGYTGQIRLYDQGLYYYKARVYSPTMGRFLQTDPIGYGDGPNWYNYVGSDPVNRTDPDGLTAFMICNDIHLPGIPFTLANGDLGLIGGQVIHNCFTIGSDVEGRGDGAGEVNKEPKPKNPNPKAPNPNPKPQSNHPCPRGARITLGGQASASGFFLYIGGSLAAELGVSIPVESLSNFSLRGTQFYGSGSFSGVGGFGFFAGAGSSPSVGYSPGALRSGVSGAHVVQGGAAYGVGGEASVATDGSGGSVSGGERAGVGAYAGYGGKVTATAATPQLGCTP